MVGGLSFNSLKTGVLGGEGLVCHFSGTGKLWLQSGEFYNLVNYLNAFRPVQSSSSSIYRLYSIHRPNPQPLKSKGRGVRSTYFTHLKTAIGNEFYLLSRAISSRIRAGCNISLYSSLN